MSPRAGPANVYARRVPLVTGEFHEVVVNPSDAAGWATVTPVPDLLAPFFSAMLGGDPVAVYVVDADAGILAFAGNSGQVAVGLTAGAFASVGPAWPKLAVEGLTIYGAHPDTGALVTFDPLTNVMRVFSAQQQTDLKVFIPTLGG